MSDEKVQRKQAEIERLKDRIEQLHKEIETHKHRADMWEVAGRVARDVNQYQASMLDASMGVRDVLYKAMSALYDVEASAKWRCWLGIKRLFRLTKEQLKAVEEAEDAAAKLWCDLAGIGHKDERVAPLFEGGRFPGALWVREHLNQGSSRRLRIDND